LDEAQAAGQRLLQQMTAIRKNASGASPAESEQGGGLGLSPLLNTSKFRLAWGSHCCSVLVGVNGAVPAWPALNSSDKRKQQHQAKM